MKNIYQTNLFVNCEFLLKSLFKNLSYQLHVSYIWPSWGSMVQLANLINLKI